MTKRISQAKKERLLSVVREAEYGTVDLLDAVEELDTCGHGATVDGILAKRFPPEALGSRKHDKKTYAPPPRASVEFRDSEQPIDLAKRAENRELSK